MLHRRGRFSVVSAPGGGRGIPRRIGGAFFVPDDGRTALHLAAGEGASKVAAKLVELGADVKRADRQGRNALEIARAAGYYDLEARLRLLSES